MSGINNQFSVGVHVMTALGDHHGEPVTSVHLTTSVRAHESQVRSVLSKLVKAGLVVTSRGRNGFSSLSRPANKISLLEIYKAVKAPPVFSIHKYPKEKTCRTSCNHKEAMACLNRCWDDPDGSANPALSNSYWAEAEVLQLAYAYEQATAWHKREPAMLARPAG
jgi:DNA-binding IscR family transcriptional regulator